MPLAKSRIIAALVVLTAVTTYGFQSAQSALPWPTPAQTVSTESPALPVAEALKTFSMPPGYHLEVAASEPMIQDPVAIDWDADGRLWAVEMPGFVQELATPEPNLDPIGRVVVLEDTDNDGRMDKRTVFADGLVLARSLKVLDRGGVLVAEPPNIWLMRDTNGDLRMDTKELVTDRYGRREGRVEENASDLHWGLDNWIHTADSDMYLRLKDGKFDVQKTLSRGEWGVTHDDAGRVYRNTNDSALHVDFVPTPYFARNPNLVRTRGSYEALDGAEAADAINTVWPSRPNPGTNRAYQTGIDRPDGTLEKFTSVCTPLVYRGDRLPAELYGNVFVAEPAANVVSRIVVTDDGTTLRAKKAYEKGEFLTSTDERFRPVFLANAPDGTLYIADMYRGIIQQRADVTQYLRDYIVSRKLERPTAYGRIYRVVHDTTRRNTQRGLSKLSLPQLADTLSNPSGWWSDTAQQLLVERGNRSVVPALVKLAGTAAEPRTRLHALWTLDALDGIDAATVTKALDDPSRDVRVAAIRLAERWLGEANHPIQAAVLKHVDDADWAVPQQLAASLGAFPPGARETAAAFLLQRRAGDPIVVDAALSGLRGSETATLDKVMESIAQMPQRETAITMLAATIVRGAQDAAVQGLFASLAANGRPDWQRAAILRGAEVALLNAPAPGTPGRRGGAPAAAALPCPTCPGGRAGPGGSYAYTRTPAPGNEPPAGIRAIDATVLPPGGGRGGARSLRLNREPVALSSLAAAGGLLGLRAVNLLPRVEWPGKPGAAAPVAPLSPEEQVRFNAGQEVYRNVCQSCHQVDGRGQEKVAASLVGSPLALGPAGIPARILLHGKEGPIGLMPPVGQVFTDDQIAAVLTYIRREWGQAGSPVDAAMVKSVREATAGRARPWTNDELLRLLPGAAQQP